MFTKKRGRKIKAVIFDFDNTLNNWDNIQAEVEVYIGEKISAKHRLNPKYFLGYLTKVRDKYYMSRRPDVAYNRKLWFKEVFAHFKIHEDVDKTVEDYWRYGHKVVKLLPGAKKVLKALQGKYKIAMLSDSDGDRKYKVARAKKLGVYEYFDVFVPTDDVGVNKPNIRCFRYVVDKLGVKPSECVMIGDHPEADLSAAKKLGMVTIWTQQAFKRDSKIRYVDFVVDKIDEVLDIIKKLDSKR